MRKALALGSAAVAVVALSTPAFANAGTVATFELTGNSSGLAISVPDGSETTPVALGTAATGAASVAGNLGDVTVTDTRGNLVAAWTATVSATDFVTGTAASGETAAATAARTVAKANIRYTSNAPVIGTSQVGVMTPSTALTLAAPGNAGVWAGVGNNTVKWNPTLTFTLLPSQVKGVYKGTVTHSVA